jgi:hypothetical protein
MPNRQKLARLPRFCWEADTMRFFSNGFVLVQRKDLFLAVVGVLFREQTMLG